MLIAKAYNIPDQSVTIGFRPNAVHANVDDLSDILVINAYPHLCCRHIKSPRVTGAGKKIQIIKRYFPRRGKRRGTVYSLMLAVIKVCQLLTHTCAIC